MIDEFTDVKENQTLPELNTSQENNNFEEYTNANEESFVQENVDAENQPITKTKSTNKFDSKKIYGASAAVAGVVAAVFVAITVIAGGATNYIVNLLSMKIFGTSFDYAFSVCFDYQLDDNAYVDFNEIDTGLRLIVVNSSYSKIINFISSSEDENSNAQWEKGENGKYSLTYNFSGNVDGLQEGTRYRVQVIGDENNKTVVYYNEDIKTLGGKTTKFESVDWQCHCAVNDTFTFKMNYTDENDYYSEFSYSFIENIVNDNPEESVTPMGYKDILITNPHNTQTIKKVSSLRGDKYNLIIKFLSSAESDIKDDTLEKITDSDGSIKAIIIKTVPVTI